MVDRAIENLVPATLAVERAAASGKARSTNSTGTSDGHTPATPTRQGICSTQKMTPFPARTDNHALRRTRKIATTFATTRVTLHGHQYADPARPPPRGVADARRLSHDDREVRSARAWRDPRRERVPLSRPLHARAHERRQELC